MQENAIAEFKAYLPAIQSAISVGGDESRIKLDAPRSEIAEVLKLAAYGPDKVLRIVISEA